MLVCGVREDAARERQGGAVRTGEVAADPGAQDLLVARRERVAIEDVGVDRLSEVVVPTDLEARYAEHGKAVEESLRGIEDEDRERAEGELGRSRRLGPDQHLALRGGEAARPKTTTGRCGVNNCRS